MSRDVRLAHYKSGDMAMSSREAVIAQLEHLANVPAGSLADVLRQVWPPGADGEAARRIDMLRNEFVYRAAAVRLANARAASELKAVHPTVQDLVDEMRRARPRLTKTAAFEQLARSSGRSFGTIRNLYYLSHAHDGVNTVS